MPDSFPPRPRFPRGYSSDWEFGSDGADLNKLLAEKERQLAAMRDIALALGSTLDLDQLLQLVMEHTTRLLDADRSTLFLIDRQSGEMWSKIAQGDDVYSEIRLKVGQGLAGWVARHGEAINIIDAYQDERFNPDIDRRTGYRTQSVLAVPVRNSHGELIGVVQALNKRSGVVFTDAEELLLEALTHQIAVSIENATMYSAVLRHNEELERAHTNLTRRMKELDLLFYVEQAMSQAVTVEELLGTVVARTMALVGAEAGSIVLQDETTGELYFNTVIGGREAELKKVRLKRGEGIAGWVVANARPALVGETASDSRHLTTLAEKIGFMPRSILCVPLPGQGGAIGAIELLDKKDSQTFTKEDVRLITLLAGQIAPGLNAAREREERERESRLAALGQMLSGIVHDFKTPMAVVSGYTELLAITDDPAERQKQAELIFRQIEQLQEMTRELLQFARGETEVLLHKVDVQHFVASVEETLAAEFKDTPLHHELASLYSGFVQMDEGKMLRVIQNIARNARQAMEPLGRGTFTITLQQEDEHLAIHCADNGPGIAEEIGDHLFDSFATYGKAHGTGLGLAIVKRIVQQHYGTVSYTSAAGEGTVFHIQIPLRVVTRPPEGA